jgi:hypothetical protein
MKIKCIFCKNTGLCPDNYEDGDTYCDCSYGKNLIKRDENIKPILGWGAEEAKEWMNKTGMEHIKDGLLIEGASLIYSANWGTGCESEDQFRQSIKTICWWDDEYIDKVLSQFLN